MMEPVRHCTVWPMENRLVSSFNQIQGWKTVRESYSRALGQGPLFKNCTLPPHLLDVLLGPGGEDLVLGVCPAEGLQHLGSLLVELVVALIRLSDLVHSLGG